MLKFASTVCLIAFASLTGAQTVEMLYDFTIASEYRGLIFRQNIQSDSDMVNFVGEHRGGRTDLDVLVVEAVSSVIKVFPSPIINHFTNLQRARFANANMTEFSSPIQTCGALETIYVGYNELTSIPAGIFRNCQNLTELSFTSNLLTDINNEAFVGLGNLQFLLLNLNNFVQINSNAFAPLVNLLTLDLSDNKIVQVSAATFQSSPRLREIGFHRNRITSWNRDILVSNRELRSLLLSENLISTITDNMFPDTLQRLSVGGLIETIPRFTNLQMLQELTLSNNKIKNVSIEVFDQLSALQILSLSGNEIAHFDFTAKSAPMLRNLITLYMTNNSIVNVPDNAFSSLTSLNQLNLGGNNIERLNRNSIRPTITSLRFLILQHNKIARIERELFESVSSLTLRMIGNVCFDDDVVINRDFGTSLAASLMAECFNFASTTRVNILILIVSLIASVTWFQT